MAEPRQDIEAVLAEINQLEWATRGLAELCLSTALCRFPQGLDALLFVIADRLSTVQRRLID